MLSCEISSTTPPRFSVSPVYPLLLVIVFALLMSFPAKADSHAGAAAALRSDQITFPVPVVTSPACGRGCRCSHNATVANCSYANLAAVPPFPASTRVLVLDWNHIRRLDENHGVGAIQPMTSSSLVLLSISHNNLSDIAPTSLRGLDSLHQLRLDHNRLERLPAAMFADTPSLGVLSLAGNSRLGMASLGAALNASRLLFLRFLDLSRVDTVCAVDARLPEAVFSQLPALQHLVLCDITIANMSADFFTALSGTSLATLDLGGSSIGKVNDTSLAPLAESLEQLVLDRAIVSPRALDAMFAGLAAGGNKTRLLSLSLRNVFVDDTHDAAVGHHLFRHLSLTRSLSLLLFIVSEKYVKCYYLTVLIDRITVISRSFVCIVYASLSHTDSLLQAK